MQMRMYRAAKKVTKLPKDPDLAFCYDILNNVSRRCALSAPINFAGKQVDLL